MRQAGNPQYRGVDGQAHQGGGRVCALGLEPRFLGRRRSGRHPDPVFFVAGSVDDVSGYAPGVRNIFEASVNAPRYLLTYENANHNAGAPMPAPAETYKPVANLKFIPAEHYIDAVWDNVRMNNIAQHFSTAFLGKYLKNDAGMDAYLNLVEKARDGKWSAEENGTFKAGPYLLERFPGAHGGRPDPGAAQALMPPPWTPVAVRELAQPRGPRTAPAVAGACAVCVRR